MSRCFQKWVVAVVLRVVHAALVELPALDQRVRREFDRLPEGMSYAVCTGFQAPTLFVEWKEGRLHRRAALASPVCSLTVKSLSLSFLLFTGRLGIAQGYARHAFRVSGDVADVMKLARLVNLVEAYLFPRFITKRILTDVPTLQASPLRVYARLFFGFLTGRYAR